MAIELLARVLSLVYLGFVIILIVTKHMIIESRLWLNAGNIGLVRLIIDLNQTDDATTVEEFFDMSLRSYPNSNAYRGLGNYYFAVGDTNKAIDFWHSSGTALEIYNRAKAYESAGQLELASQMYASAASPDAYAALGDLQARRGNIADAIVGYKIAASLTIDGERLHHVVLGHAYRLQGNWDAAIAQYQAALELEPGDVNIYLKLGWVLHRGKADYRHAIEAYEHALIIQPENMWALINIGEAYLDLGETVAAENLFRSASKANPTAGEPWAYLAISASRSQRCDDALMLISSALYYDETNSIVNDAMAQVSSVCIK